MYIFIEYVLPWILITGCAVAYTWSVHSIGYERGKREVHSWYSKATTLDRGLDSD